MTEIGQLLAEILQFEYVNFRDLVSRTETVTLGL